MDKDEHISVSYVKKKFKESEELVICNGPCNKKVHAKCVGFTSTTLKFFKECDNLLYECDICQKNPMKIMTHSVKKMLSFMCIFNERLCRQEINCDSIFKNLDGVNNSIIDFKGEMKDELNKISNTYADTLKAPVAVPVVLVKPKKIQKCSETLEVGGHS